MEADFTINGLDEYLQDQIQNNLQAVIETFQFVGETFVRKARLKKEFRDITGNLRSSIGYIILRDGKQIKSDFKQSDAGSEKSKGVASGLAFAKELAEQYPSGIILIVVAGMEYAAAVESKGKDVITGSSLGVQKQLERLLSSL